MNRLAHESSPYLQQHATNPVDWFAWGDDAFAEARRRDVPVLLSIGYAACHWCHVMAHESFEDEATARIMNELFVNVKVDREERPDVDSIYMQAVQAITGHGGWPMTMFLTPDGVPFYGGTYFPPEDRHGMPSFQRILVSVSEAWKTKREDVLRGATTLRGIYAGAEAPTSAEGELTPEQFRGALQRLLDSYDPEHGGFGRGAPKFPQPMLLDVLLRQHARRDEPAWLERVRHSFMRMADGGLYDQLGGGFHRYTVDGAWLVPHFEKMLYDNALLARLAVRLWQATGDPQPRRIAEETFAWLRREMRAPEGGWYSALDADSEGHEGKFYVWTFAELAARLGGLPERDAILAFWGATPEGNFEGANILHVREPLESVAERSALPPAALADAVARARGLLFAAREPRARPARDEKVLAGWNGLMLRAVAEAARAFDSEVLRTDALATGAFLAGALIREGRVLRSWRDGVARVPGYLEDHAALGLGFLALYELTASRAWLDLALMMDRACVRWFWSEEAGAFFDTAHDAERLVTRPRDITDNAIPSGTSLAVELQLACAALTGDGESRRRAEYVLATLAEPMRRSPMAFGHLLGAADTVLHGAVELAIAGDPDGESFRALARAAGRVFVPSLVFAGGMGASVADLPIMEGRAAPDGAAIAYVCRDFACDAPTPDPAVLTQQLEAAPR